MWIKLALLLLLSLLGQQSASQSMDDNKSLAETLQRIEKSLFEKDETIKSLEAKVEILEKQNPTIKSLEKKVEILEKQNPTIKSLEAKVEILEKQNPTIKSLEEKVDTLEKQNAKKSCQELANSGTTTDGSYFVDPDGPDNKTPPFQVRCEFTVSQNDGTVTASTTVAHNLQLKTQVSQCSQPGCYKRALQYDGTKNQLQLLARNSKKCSQSVRYDCYLSPLTRNGVQFGYWSDKNGGSHTFCDSICKCDGYKPDNMSDTTVITDKTKLPISKVNYGGLEFPTQRAYHTVGPLVCTGFGEMIYSEPEDSAVAVCGYQNSVRDSSGYSVVTYDKTLFPEVNSFLEEVFSINTGVFTAPVDGIYRMDYGAGFVETWQSAKGSHAFKLYKNDVEIPGSKVHTNVAADDSNDDVSMHKGILLPLTMGDKLDLRHGTGGDPDTGTHVSFCVKLEFIIKN